MVQQIKRAQKYIGDEWTVRLTFGDGTTIDEHAHQTGEDVWEAVSDGVNFVGEITEELIDDVDTFTRESISGAKSQYTYPEVSNDTSVVDITNGSEKEISGDDISEGTSSVGGFLSNWMDGTIPFFESAYADWEKGGLVEATSMSKGGAAYGMCSIASSFKIQTDQTKSGYIDINYDWAAHLTAYVGTANLIISPFVRNVTTGDSEIIDHTQEKAELLSLNENVRLC